MSPDERYLVTGRAYTDQVNVADLIERRSWSVSAGTGITMTLGVAFNRAQRNHGRLAIHGCSQVLVDDFAADGTLREVGRTNLRGGSFCGAYLRGRLAWSGSGTRVIAAFSDQNAWTGWAVLSVDETTGRVERVGNIGHCSDSLPYGVLSNDVLTANGYVPTATAWPSASPSSSPTVSPTPSPSPTPSATPTRTATATRPLMPLYLPVALREHCRPGTQRIDLALVIDGSTTMREDLLAIYRTIAVEIPCPAAQYWGRR